jgi:flagellar biosynthesis chaperone FliJ
MNLPTTKITLTQIQTFSNKLYTNAVYNSLQDFLSETNATIYQNNNKLQQAYTFVQKLNNKYI